MKVFGLLFAIILLVLMAAPALAGTPKTAADCDRADGKCRYLRCPKNLKAIGRCDTKGGVCCKAEKK